MSRASALLCPQWCQRLADHIQTTTVEAALLLDDILLLRSSARCSLALLASLDPVLEYPWLSMTYQWFFLLAPSWRSSDNCKKDFPASLSSMLKISFVLQSTVGFPLNPGVAPWNSSGLNPKALTKMCFKACTLKWFSAHLEDVYQKSVPHCHLWTTRQTASVQPWIWRRNISENLRRQKSIKLCIPPDRWSGKTSLISRKWISKSMSTIQQLMN